MNKLFFCLTIAIIACQSQKSTFKEKKISSMEHQVMSAVSKRVSEDVGKRFNVIETREKVKIPTFENVDSVIKSIGYTLYDELVFNSKSTASEELKEIPKNCIPPYLMFSDVVFDNEKNHCIVSYVKYYGPLASEEICAIYRIHKKDGLICSVELLWSQSLSVS